VTNTFGWGPSLRKEFRALLPVWAATMVALVASGLALQTRAGNVVRLIYIIGAVTLGAYSIGHEYLSGTLTYWLAQPVDRRRLFASKLAVLAPLLTAIAGLAALLLSPGDGVADDRALLTTLPLGFALGVAPWLTMLARGPLGGGVFTAASFLLILAGTVWTEDPFERTVSAWRFEAPFWVFCAIGAVFGWRTFMRLEAIDTARDIEFPRFGTKNATAKWSRPSRLSALISKELRLQQLTILCAALSFGLMVIANGMRHSLTGTFAGISFPLSILHLLVVPVLAGAMASAEERRLGTLEAQVLQPVANWKQWSIKAGVVIGITLVLGMGLLMLLVAVDPTADIVGATNEVQSGAVRYAFAIGPPMFVEIALLALYVSSISISGLRAVAATAVVLSALLSAAASPWQWVAQPRVRSAFSVLSRWVLDRMNHDTSHAFERVMSITPDVLISMMAVCCGLLLFWLGLRNHRSAERGTARVWRQGAALLASLVVAILVVAGGLVMQASAHSVAHLTIAERQALSSSASRHTRWSQGLAELTKNFDGRVGVCMDDGITSACVRASEPFPMQSVMKLPLAIAVLDAVDHDNIHLDDPVLVRKEDLSVYVQPIARLVGPDGFKTTIDDLLRRAIVDSDNAAADILMAKLGGPSAVQIVLNRKGISSVRVDRDEKHLQSEINGLEWRPEYVDPPTFDRAVAAVPADKRNAAFQAYLRDHRDTATPVMMTFMLDFIGRGRILSPESCRRLIDILKQTTTMPDRLKAGAPEGWTIGHKTGTSGDWNGVNAATNDVGILFGPQGERVTVVVFIAESRAPEKDRAALMASIARLAATKY
jgi:beta-lactamase class A